MPSVSAQNEYGAHSPKEQDDGHKFTSVALGEDDSHQSTSVVREGKNDSHQFTSAPLQEDDSHQSTPVMLEDTHQSASVLSEGKDDSHSHQSTSVPVEGKDESHQSTSVQVEGKDNSDQSTSVPRERKNDTQQSSSPLCPASPEPPPIPLDPPSAKDRGYAWVVVWVAFGVNVFTAGYVKSFGIMYLLLLQCFPDASGAAAGWIMGLLFGARALLSPVSGALTVKLGGRLCCLIGSAFITFGLLLAVPTFSIYYMAVTLGGLVGFGLCLCETPGILLVNDYFLEKRSTANGFRVAGNPLGGILFPPLLVFLSKQFGVQGTFVVLAGIMLQLTVLGALMRPFEQHERVIHLQHARAVQSQLGTTTYGIVAAHTHKDKHPSKKKALDFTLLTNPRYLIYVGVALSLNITLPNFLIYIPAYANSVGLSEYEISTITAYVSAIDFVLRLLSGFITDKLHLNETHLFPVGLLVGGLGCLLVPLCSNLWQLMLSTTLFAYGLANFWALLTPLLTRHFGAELTASTWGFFRMTQGISNFVYPSLLGLIKDVTGGYVVPFLVMGAGFMLGSGIFLLHPLAAKLSNKMT